MGAEVVGADIGAALRGRAEALRALAGWLRRRARARDPRWEMAQRLGVRPPDPASVIVPTTLADMAVPHPADPVFHLPVTRVAAGPLLALITRPRLERVLYEGFDSLVDIARKLKPKVNAAKWRRVLGRQVSRMEDLPGLLEYIQDVNLRSYSDYPATLGKYSSPMRLGVLYPRNIGLYASDPLRTYVATVAHEIGPGGHAGLEYMLEKGQLGPRLSHYLTSVSDAMYEVQATAPPAIVDVLRSWTPHEVAAHTYADLALRPRYRVPTRLAIQRALEAARRVGPGAEDALRQMERGGSMF